MNDIRLFDYLRQYEGIKSETLAAVGRVLESGVLILGPEVASFEREFAATMQVYGEAVGVGSGTGALIVALLSLGVGPGDEVVTVPNTAVPTVSAIRSTGATPVFCDVDASTCLMSLDQLESVISPKTKAVVPVHLFGNVVDVPCVRQIIGSRAIHIVEDCAQAQGAAWNGSPVGGMGDVGAFSFYPTKNLGAYGDGGLCFTRDKELAQRMRQIRMYGFATAGISEREGINSRLDELQAAILRVKLPHLAGWVARRQTIAARYDGQLSVGIERTPPNAGGMHAYHLYVVKVQDRDACREALARQGVGTGIHYATPIHLMSAYHFLGYSEGSLPVSESLAGRILSLPMYPELDFTDVDRVCEALNTIAGSTS